jgi:hypothetical protein
MILKLMDEILFSLCVITFTMIFFAIIGDFFYEIYEWVAYDLFKKQREIEPIIADWEWEEICERSKR